MIKLKDILESRIGGFTWSGHIEKGRSLDKTVGGQPAGKSVPRRVAEGGRGMLSIFDFDDTLVKSLAWIYIKKNGKVIKKLSPAFLLFLPIKNSLKNFGRALNAITTYL